MNGGLGADIYIHSGTAADGSDTVNTGDDGFDRILFSTADLDDLNFMRDGNVWCSVQAIRAARPSTDRSA